MAQNVNQFAMTPEKGLMTLEPNWSTFNCQVAASEAGTLVPGQAVLISDVTGEQIPVVKAAATTDAIFGIIPLSVKKNEYVAYDQVKIARGGDVIFLEAAAAIARGALLEFVVSGNKVQTKNTGVQIGRALDKATASGQLIKVLLTLE